MRTACLRQQVMPCSLCALTICQIYSITSTSRSWADRWTAFTLLDSVRARKGCRTPVTKWEGRVGSGLHTADKGTHQCSPLQAACMSAVSSFPEVPNPKPCSSGTLRAACSPHPSKGRLAAGVKRPATCRACHTTWAPSTQPASCTVLPENKMPGCRCWDHLGHALQAGSITQQGPLQAAIM